MKQKYKRHLGRFRYLKEAVDSGDEIQYYEDRIAWMLEHGYKGRIRMPGGKTVNIPLRRG